MPKHYTVIYNDERNQRRHFCCYATGVYEARIAAMELNAHIHAHPNSITHIITNNNDDWQ